jgi:hypothetical protein
VSEQGTTQAVSFLLPRIATRRRLAGTFLHEWVTSACRGRLHRIARSQQPPPPRCTLTAAVSTEPARLGCSSEQASRGASCDAPPVSCPCCCRTGELHAPSPTSAPTLSSVTTSLHSSEQQGYIALKSRVASVFHVFQMFHLNVACV